MVSVANLLILPFSSGRPLFRPSGAHRLCFSSKSVLKGYNDKDLVLWYFLTRQKVRLFNLNLFIMPKTVLVSSYEDFVPRHRRFGVCVETFPCVVATHEVVENVPVLNSNGNVVMERPVVVRRPAHECLSQYRRKDFLIDSLLDAGVPLQEVVFDRMSRSIDESLVDKAISLGLLSEEFNDFSFSVSPSNTDSVSPSNTESNE